MIGILILDTDFPRLPGDIGNPASFQTETIYHRVSGASVDAVVSGEPIDGELLDTFIGAARDLEKRGATVIGTSCGFLGAVQSEIQRAINVPFLASSLSLIPLLRTAFGQDSQTAVFTFAEEKLGDPHFGEIDRSNISVHGLSANSSWRQCIANNRPTMDEDQARLDVLDVVDRAISGDSKPRILVIECTNLSPWKTEIRQRSQLPVFDLVDALEWLQRAYI